MIERQDIKNLVFFYVCKILQKLLYKFFGISKLNLYNKSKEGKKSSIPCFSYIQSKGANKVNYYKVTFT